VGYISVADKTDLFICLVAPVTQILEIPMKFELIAVYRHLRSSILVVIKSVYATSYCHYKCD